MLQLERERATSSDPENPSAEELRTLLEDASRIAVIGLSRDPAKAARRVPAYLAVQGYELVPVNPFADRILGRQAYAEIGEVPGEVDIVVIFRPSAQAGPFVLAAADRPERPAVWLQTGITAAEEAAAVRARGQLVVQDLCVFRVHRAIYG